MLGSSELSTRSRALLQDHDTYLDKVYGSWYGKLIGLTAGQPVEGWTKEAIELASRVHDIYPITYYFPADFESGLKEYLYGNFDGCPVNDDSDLMLTSLMALREKGIHIEAADIARMWRDFVSAACTAEGIAIYNFNRGIWPPQSAEVGNPYQEWIGAQMRGDIWGMIAPGTPETAIKYAAIDSSMSHTGNGLYAEQFVSAMVSIAMVETAPEVIIRTALSYIPADCRYAKAINDVLDWHAAYPEWETTWERIDSEWGTFPDGSRVRSFGVPEYDTCEGIYIAPDMKWVHADVNGAIVVLAMLYGKGDFTQTLGIATMSGYDSDCNVGTVGAILGAALGETGIPDNWKQPMHDIYHTNLKLDNSDLVISEIAKETAEYGLKVMSEITS